MAKPFLTYDQQLHKLSDDKNLQISDKDFAGQKLKEVGYFALIGGYKEPFIDPMTRVYLNTSFEDVYALYVFDRDLRELTFRYLCEIEQQLRQLISYSFCQQYGEQQSSYLTEANYNVNAAGSYQLKKLINKLDNIANHDTEHVYVKHQRTTYQNVPLWVTMNVLTFGQISHLYSMLPFALQSDVSKEYPGINERQLEQYLATLTLFRNVCAHNERLYSYKIRKDFPNTTLHHKLMIPLKGQQYTNGKRDYYGVFIAFRYLLSDQSFKKYKKGLFKLVDHYCRTSTRLTCDELMTAMGFAGKWQNIMRYKK